ncbi:hypothetical protein DICSQDRAFT_128135 [Dichomitus squalens LYAD-421 SS1]|uniref:HNH nuclease domain-containing protein n=1 Tax=Dichomitus squalens (strain LYAD-421) TaxID=732165 RepID=R7SXB2_DICSQ|nr:uncharacterized protein DICSQDRAFT_128135 [Dichomitus squalens LYAD-421 SS1]EJF59622.1 hypothetical protein DICSQDRAFT_128135 [Dichomitus squalens LYAD-421 SS1]
MSIPKEHVASVTSSVHLSDSEREEVRKNWGQKCALCRHAEDTQCAHIVSRTMIENYSLVWLFCTGLLERGFKKTDQENFILLCKSCHALYDNDALAICPPLSWLQNAIQKELDRRGQPDGHAKIRTLPEKEDEPDHVVIFFTKYSGSPNQKNDLAIGGVLNRLSVLSEHYEDEFPPIIRQERIRVPQETLVTWRETEDGLVGILDLSNIETKPRMAVLAAKSACTIGGFWSPFKVELPGGKQVHMASWVYRKKLLEFHEVFAFNIPQYQSLDSKDAMARMLAQATTLMAEDSNNSYDISTFADTSFNEDDESIPDIVPLETSMETQIPSTPIAIRDQVIDILENFSIEDITFNQHAPAFINDVDDDEDDDEDDGLPSGTILPPELTSGIQGRVFTTLGDRDSNPSDRNAGGVPSGEGTFPGGSRGNQGQTALPLRRSTRTRKRQT